MYLDLFFSIAGPIKTICETELGIVSQCCNPKQAQKLNKQYLENLSLKINVKVGGRNTVLNDAILRRIPLVSDRPTIIIGADVTHPQAGEDSSPSIAAVSSFFRCCFLSFNPSYNHFWPLFLFIISFVYFY